PTVSIAQAIKPAAPPAKSPRKRQNMDDSSRRQTRVAARYGTSETDESSIEPPRPRKRPPVVAVGCLFGRSGSASIQQQQPKLSSVCERCGRFLRREKRNDQT